MDEAHKKEEERERLREQIKQYKKLFPRYQTYAQVLQKVMEQAIRKHTPLAIEQSRAKSIASFGEKCCRKKTSYRDSVNRMTDLCGVRVIVPTLSEVKAISEFIESHFDIDWDNTVDISQRLKPTEFGYRGIHYIVKFKPGIFPTKDIDIKIPGNILGLKAEIQVKTILEHAWGVFTHDRVYKGAFKIPDKWERELAALAAVLESTDSSFARIHDGLQKYGATYGAYMTEEQMRDEIENAKIILGHDPGNVELIARIGKLAITLGDFQKAIDELSPHSSSNYQPILRDLGVALCKLHKGNPKGKEYLQGRKYLETAAAPHYRDPDAIASLAGTWKGIDDDKARELYRQAFEIDPSDPYPLGNYLEYEIERSGNTSLVGLLRPVIENAIQRCRDQADVDMNLPWAFYDMGKFYMLLNKPYESLVAYAKAIELSSAEFMIDTSLQSLGKLAIVSNELPGYQWARRLLMVGQAAKFPTEKATGQVKELASANSKPIPGPVIIVAGGTDASVEQQMQEYHHIMLEAFRDFEGTIISGGTTAGVSGIVGDIGQQYPTSIRTIGYVPSATPDDVSLDQRYSEIRTTEGDEFSPLQPLQNWIDLIASGVAPSQVKLLGINGGPIAAVEYRIALALGARVAVIEDSGREAAKLLPDDDWVASETLICLPADAMTVKAFIGVGSSELSSDILETIAQAIHDDYRSERAKSGRAQDPAMADWDKLLDHLKESNLQQADDIIRKLHHLVFTVHKVTDRPVSLMTFTEDEIENMAKMEHARWNVERLLDGWKRGDDRDVLRKISPYIVGWAELPDDVKGWDRNTVRKIPEFLAKVGLEIRRQE